MKLLFTIAGFLAMFNIIEAKSFMSFTQATTGVDWTNPSRAEKTHIATQIKKHNDVYFAGLIAHANDGAATGITTFRALATAKAQGTATQQNTRGKNLMGYKIVSHVYNIQKRTTTNQGDKLSFDIDLAVTCTTPANCGTTQDGTNLFYGAVASNASPTQTNGGIRYMILQGGKTITEGISGTDAEEFHGKFCLRGPNDETIDIWTPSGTTLSLDSTTTLPGPKGVLDRTTNVPLTNIIKSTDVLHASKKKGTSATAKSVYFRTQVTTTEPFHSMNFDQRVSKEAAIDRNNNAVLNILLEGVFEKTYLAGTRDLANLDDILTCTSNSYNLRSWTSTSAATALRRKRATGALLYSNEITCTFTDSTADSTTVATQLLTLINSAVFKDSYNVSGTKLAITATKTTSTASTSSVAFAAGLVSTCLALNN